jgi:hypothetical protein
VSRTRCSAQRCTADPGPSKRRRLGRSRVGSAPLRVALRPGYRPHPLPNASGVAMTGARRRDGRVAEGARLESVYTGNRIVGSNPTPSARYRPQLSITSKPFIEMPATQ